MTLRPTIRLVPQKRELLHMDETVRALLPIQIQEVLRLPSILFRKPLIVTVPFTLLMEQEIFPQPLM